MNNLSLDQINIIKTELSKDSASDFVRAVVLEYANQSLDSMNHLLTTITAICQCQLNAKQNRINRYCWAYETMLGHRLTSRIEQNKRKHVTSPLSFPTLLAGGIAHFPTLVDGYSYSPAEFAFINELRECIITKNGFDYTCPGDWVYVEQIADCAEWLRGFIRVHIDPTFEIPEEKK